MDIQTLAIAKRYTNLVALGISSMSVSGTTVTFVTTSGVTAKVTLPTPENGIGIKNVTISADCHLLCTMTDDSVIDAGVIGSVLTKDIDCNVAIGSVKSGDKFLAGTPIETIIAKMLTVYQKPVAAIVIVPTTTVYDVVNDSLDNIQIKAVATKKSKDIVKIEWKANGTTINTKTTEVTEGGTFGYTYVPGTPIKQTTKFSVVVSDEDNSVSAEVTVSFVPKSYWGIVGESVESPLEADIKGLAYNELKTKRGLTYSDVLMTNSRIVYAYPKSFGALTSIVSKEGYDYMSSYAQTTITVDGIDYYCYTLKEPASIVTTGYKQIFA